jgi:hypothetical protein
MTEEDLLAKKRSYQYFTLVSIFLGDILLFAAVETNRLQAILMARLRPLVDTIIIVVSRHHFRSCNV